MEITEEMQDDINIYRLHGHLDSYTSREFEQKLFQAISNGSKNMVLNLAGLQYISSAGIGVILKIINAVRRIDGRIMLCCMQDYVREVFEIAGVGVLLPIFATNDDALNAF